MQGRGGHYLIGLDAGTTSVKGVLVASDGREHKFLLLPDYLVYRLTGRYVTEYSIVSSSLCFDFRRKEWWGEMLDFLGIETSRLAETLKGWQR